MKYNFDEEINRTNTHSVKYDMRQSLFGSDDVIPMWVADMDFRTPDFVIDAIKKRLEHEIFGYTIKSESFYQSIVNWMQLQHQWQVKREWLSFSPGVVPALSLSILAFTKPGDKIIIQSPVYHPFYFCINDNGRQLVDNPLKFENNRYVMDLDDLEKKIDSRTSMLILSNPHNPVGRVWTKEELKKLGDICAKHQILILSDEIHSDLIFAPNKHVPLASISEEIAAISITAIAPSKTFNLAGLSCSAMIIPNLKLLTRYNNLLNTIHVGLGNIFGLVAMEAAYTHGKEWLNQLLDYLSANQNFLIDYLNEKIPELKVIRAEGTYLIWIDFRNLKLKNNKSIKDFLNHDAKIGLNNGSMFGKEGEGFFRMNIACPRKILTNALENLEKAVIANR